MNIKPDYLNAEYLSGLNGPISLCHVVNSVISSRLLGKDLPACAIWSFMTELYIYRRRCSPITDLQKNRSHSSSQQHSGEINSAFPRHL